MLDLFGPHFTLVTGRCAEGWRVAAGEIADELRAPLLDRTTACGGGHRGDRGAWTGAYGIEATSEVLIRPDGHVAWRRAAAIPSPAVELLRVLNAVLGRCGNSFRSDDLAQG